MPPELTQALVQCGKAHAFYALQAPQWLLQHYNLTDTQNLVGQSLEREKKKKWREKNERKKKKEEEEEEEESD